MRLTAAQQAAVSAGGSVSLVSCPGSGKTRTLVAKILRLVDRCDRSPRAVACITYTNAAVSEIEARLSTLVGGESGYYEIETIHSFCLKHIIVPHLWRLAPFTQGFEIVPPDDPRFEALVASMISDYRLRRRVADEFGTLARGTGTFPTNISPAVAADFWSRLDQRRWIDFNSMIYWSAELIACYPYIARGIASRYRNILVDEFQDTSDLQAQILLAVASHCRSTFFSVGDPFQSIMSVAGARPALMAEFARKTESRVDLQLLENYRSSAPILRAADRLTPRDAPMLAVGPHRTLTLEPTWHLVPSMLQGLMDIFVPAAAALGIQHSGMAVLAARWMSLFPLARGLRRRGVAAVGPGARPYRRSANILAPLVEELAAYVSEPHAVAMVAVRRELRRLIGQIENGPPPRLGFLGDVVAMRLGRMLRDLERSNHRATRFVERIGLRVAEYMLEARLLSVGQHDVVVAAGRSLSEEILANEQRYQLPETTSGDLGFFARGSNSIRLMTMHGAKGREFDAVAVVDLFDSHVPHFTAGAGDEIEAEGRRLFYVALTRAKQLVMVFTLSEPSDDTRPSRFLEGFLSPNRAN